MRYRTVTPEKPTAVPDGTLILVSGTDTRQVTWAALSGPDGLIERSVEPFDWSPRHGTDLEDVWGQLWTGPHRRLTVHTGRFTGVGRPPPRRTPAAPAGTALRITAHAQQSGLDRLAVTTDRHTYLLSGPELPGSAHHLTGTPLQESPPLLHVTAAHDLSRATLPPTEVSHV